MHILILPSWYINSYTPLGGIFFKEQAEALAKHGNKVGLIAIDEINVRIIYKQKKLDIYKKDFILNGVSSTTVLYPAIPKLHTIRRVFKLMIFKKIFKEYIEKNGLPDIVHLHSFMNGEFAMYLKEVYKVPYIVTEHFSGFARNIISTKQLQFAQKVFQNSSYNIAVSNEFATLLNKKFDVNFLYLPNIVNTGFFEPKNRKNSNIFQFINIAFLGKNKNQDMLVKSFAQVFKNQDNVELIIVGDGVEYDNLNRLIKELRVEKQITLYGRADREEIKKLLQNSDVFVLSSQYETFGVVVIEAMACGLPVVATKCGGPESIITEEKVGLLSEVDEEDLSNNLKKIYQNIDNYDSKYIYNFTKNNFSEKAVCLKLNDIYKKVITK